MSAVCSKKKEIFAGCFVKILSYSSLVTPVPAKYFLERRTDLQNSSNEKTARAWADEYPLFLEYFSVSAQTQPILNTSLSAFEQGLSWNAEFTHDLTTNSWMIGFNETLALGLFKQTSRPASPCIEPKANGTPYMSLSCAMG